MLFKRRDPETFKDKVRVAVWPRRSWSRSKNYVLHRIKRLDGSAHKIALGVACGVLVSFTPFFGFHFILAAIIAFLLGGSLIASALGTFFGNFLTFPLIAVASYNLGSILLGVQRTFERGLVKEIIGSFSSWEKFQNLLPVIESYLLGGVIIGAFFAVGSYYLAKRFIEAYQFKRRAKFKIKEQIAASIKSTQKSLKTLQTEHTK